LRVRLQPPAGKSSRAYLITSPAPGDGKTGVAISLGLSFAAAAYRTLLIDGDLSSRQLSRGLGAEDDWGFRDAAHGCEPTICCLRDNLSFMPAGRCRPEDQYTLAAARVVPVLDRARKQFDVIVIDSDSLLSGVARALMAPHVDGVLLTVTRDQSHATVHQALRVLEQQNAPINGAIFNRAKAAEISTSKKQSGASTDGTRSMDAMESEPMPTGQGETLGLSDRLRGFGPLGASVMASLAWSDDEELALIAPPASQPRIHIFPIMPSAAESSPKSRVA
jgi:Mrp family chromosome partitioning ATPase